MRASYLDQTFKSSFRCSSPSSASATPHRPGDSSSPFRNHPSPKTTPNKTSTSSSQHNYPSSPQTSKPTPKPSFFSTSPQKSQWKNTPNFVPTTPNFASSTPHMNSATPKTPSKFATTNYPTTPSVLRTPTPQSPMPSASTPSRVQEYKQQEALKQLENNQKEKLRSIISQELHEDLKRKNIQTLYHVLMYFGAKFTSPHPSFEDVSKVRKKILALHHPDRTTNKPIPDQVKSEEIFKIIENYWGTYKAKCFDKK